MILNPPVESQYLYLCGNKKKKKGFKKVLLYITSDSRVCGRRDMNMDKSGKPKLRKVFLR